MTTDQLTEHISQAFKINTYPGDAYLQASFESDEAYEETGAFKGKTDWTSLEPTFLDNHSSALNFFSEAAFRFYLPAYLIADLRHDLQQAEPLFHLTHGFHKIEVQIPVGTQTFTRRSGGQLLLNPQRYGAMTFEDYARYRLSVFVREEVEEIIAYLNYQRDHDLDGMNREAITLALDGYWLERVQTASTRAQLDEHLSQEKAYIDALMKAR